MPTFIIFLFLDSTRLWKSFQIFRNFAKKTITKIPNLEWKLQGFRINFNDFSVTAFQNQTNKCSFRHIITKYGKMNLDTKKPFIGHIAKCWRWRNGMVKDFMITQSICNYFSVHKKKCGDISIFTLVTMRLLVCSSLRTAHPECVQCIHSARIRFIPQKRRACIAWSLCDV